MGNACACCGDLLRGHAGPGRVGRRRFLAYAGAMAALPSLVSAADANYEAMLLTCIDPRFPELSLNYMRGRGMVGKYSQFTFAGAAIGAVAPAFADWHKTFWDNLAASVQLHQISRVIAIDHRDCGAAKIAYGADSMADWAVETETHRRALGEFRAQAKQNQPALEVETGLMALDGSVEMFA